MRGGLLNPLRWVGHNACPREQGEWVVELPDVCIDVHSFRARERLAVHEARTEADLWSASKSAKRVWWLRVIPPGALQARANRKRRA